MTDELPANPFDPKAFCRTLPGVPGVYRMLGEARETLYIGKARHLKKRVSSYFTKTVVDRRIATMVAQVQQIEISVTRTEAEALLLEDQLIKAHKPRYNVLLRDDKSYPYIYLSKHEFPRLAFHRGGHNLPGEFFGPFPSAYAVRDSLKQMQKLFKVRQCEDSFFANRSRPCLQYQIERCTAPCVDFIEPAEYAVDVRHARMFLNGQGEGVLNEMTHDMENSASQLDFERAAELRDRIATLRKVQAQQFVAGAKGDLDVIAVAADGSQACVQVQFFRGGRNLGNRGYFPRNSGEQGSAEILSAFLTQHYLRRDVPPQIILGEEVEDRALLAEVFSERAQRQVRLIVNPRGPRLKWLEMTRRNAENALRSHMTSHAGMQARLEDLQKLLDLDELPDRMECFDISHTQGEATVASCVVFDSEGPVKSNYRRFNIAGIEPGDDYAALRQAVLRRYKRLKSGDGEWPDILFIDGGKGQMRQALDVMEQLEIGDELLIVGVAKAPGRRSGYEKLVVGAEQREIRPGPDSAALHLIDQIRDEAHRFAIAGHRAKRGKRRQRSPLEDIEGIGPRRRRSLLNRFGGFKGVMAAGVEELGTVDGISKALAQRIYDVLHGV